MAPEAGPHEVWRHVPSFRNNDGSFLRRSHPDASTEAWRTCNHIQGVKAEMMLVPSAHKGNLRWGLWWRDACKGCLWYLYPVVSA